MAVADRAAAAGAVDHRNRRAEVFRHPVGEIARRDVGRAAGAEHDGHFDRLAGRELLGHCRRGNRRDQGGRADCDDFGSRDRTHYIPSTKVLLNRIIASSLRIRQR